MDSSALEIISKALESSLDFWGLLLLISTAVVVAGLIVEYRDETSEFWTLCRWPMSSFPWHKFRGLLGGILVTIGVAGELAFTYTASRVETKLRDNNHHVVSSLQTTISQNNLEAQRLRKETEDEHMARVEAEESVAWRKLSPSAKARLRITLQPQLFSASRTWLMYNFNDMEAFTFGDDLAEVLKAAEWHPTDVEPIELMAEGPVPFGRAPRPERGIVVSTTGEQSNEDAANALTKALVSLGFDCKRSFVPAMRAKEYGNTVFVFVEPRPEGRQGDAKLRADARNRQAKTN
jgi:hypothetical protein